MEGEGVEGGGREGECGRGQKGKNRGWGWKRGEGVRR